MIALELPNSCVLQSFNRETNKNNFLWLFFLKLWITQINFVFVHQ